jgi:hypothetical protein
MRQAAVLLGFLSCFTWSGSAFAADAQLMNLVMPDAKILAGVNVTSAENSPLGQFLLSKIGLIGGVPQDFITATGFNPLQDVSEILAATAADPSNPSGLVMARGTFPVDKIGGLLAGKTNWQVTTYGGATLVSSTNPKAKVPQGIAFIGNSVAVAGDLASVKAAIDRSTGANSIDPALTVTVNQLSGSEDEWLASATSVGSLLPSNTALGAPANGPAAQIVPLLTNIQAFNGGVKFGDIVAITGQALTSSPQNAAALNAVIKLGIILAGSAGANAGGNQQIATATQFLQTLQVATNGPAVDLSLSIPEAQIESLVNSLPAPAKKAVASAQRPELHNGN